MEMLYQKEKYCRRYIAFLEGETHQSGFGAGGAVSPGRAAHGFAAAIDPGRQLGRLRLAVRRERHVAAAAAADRRLRRLDRKSVV